MKPYVPHAYQELMINHGLRIDRCNILASPGVGKTSSALAIMDIRSMVADSYPALAIGPLRVANSVWNREVDKWANFKGLRVSKILGSLDNRIKALNTPADIYTIHYGLLRWLHEYLEGNKRSWPFKTVIADESTRLKHARPSFRKHRTSGKVSLYIAGSVNAGALARYAVRTPYWINMTGTYTPNGLQDAWGQQWFIDFGEALGSSYDAYTKRWFYQRRGTTAEQAVFEPHDHALDEITRRLKPSSISIDAYDWFDVDRPREVDIEIELPAKLMKDYRKLHREAMLKLENETVITAVNAGAITNKCIAAGTPVLTSRGWVPVQHVQITDQVWDGVEFVNHGGIICNGLQNVVDCFKVGMTPDHKVLTTQGWEEADACNRRRLDRAEVRLPNCETPCAGSSRSSSLGMSLRVRNVGAEAGGRLEESGYDKLLRVSQARRSEASEHNPRYDSTSCVASVGFYARSLLESSSSILASVWRSWNQGLQALGSFRELLVGYGRYMAERLIARTDQQSTGVLPSELQMGNTTAAVEQYMRYPTCQHSERQDADVRSRPTLWDQVDHLEVQAGQRMEGRQALVYDIANAGPRHRFTVKGSDGQALIVHNCMQYASGNVYDADKVSHFIHNEKLDALDSLMENLNGAPLLVGYHFIPTREAILKRFPKAELLPSDHRQKAVEDRWNEGRIPMLVVHPASAGHGLDLQHGGHNLCVVDPYWDFEMYAQLIERIGPVRQMQAGYDRVVSVHRMRALGTFDEVVIDRLSTKASVESAVRGAMIQ